MRRRKVDSVRISALEKQVKKNTREIKQLKKRINELEAVFSTQASKVHEELISAIFESFGLVPPHIIGSKYDEIMKKRLAGESDEQSEET